MAVATCAIALLLLQHYGCWAATQSLRLGRARSFVVQDDRFVKDGAPYTVRSGSVHYSRVPRAYWRDRLERAKALGLNTITTYVPWNFHEEVEGDFDFAHEKDVFAFVDTAAKLDLLVMLRIGPYMCGEWDFGGFPAWLATKDNITLRTHSKPYLDAVDRYWDALLPRFKQKLYGRGGPVVLVQLENEFGDYGDCSSNEADAAYMRHLYAKATQHLGTDVVYTTVSPARNLHKASPWRRDARVLATVDGALADSYAADFALQKSFNAPGLSPKMWTELWTGWYTHWGDAQAANRTARDYGAGVAAMASDANASFSLYMAHGGTSFAFWSGANILDGTYVADVTSYDYSAPISEDGTHQIGAEGQDGFEAVRQALGGTAVEPPAPVFRAYGPIALRESADLLDQDLATCFSRGWRTQEQLGQAHGFTRYTLGGALPDHLTFSPSTLRDRVQVLADGVLVGSAYRGDNKNVSVALPSTTKRLDLLVENCARVGYGRELVDDRKGFLAPPLAGTPTVQCLPLDDLSRIQWQPVTPGPAAPRYYRGRLAIDDVHDTYLDTRGLSKGIIWVNGRNLGRFWETRGPQHTLYLPAPFLKRGVNEVVVLDLDGRVGSLASVARPRWR
jgi:hypothetical protein